MLLNFVGTNTSYNVQSYYGTPSYQCIHCSTVIWYNERIRSSYGTRSVIYNNCYKGGKVRLPPYQPRPEPLLSLARFDGDATAKTFMQNTKQYCLHLHPWMPRLTDQSLMVVVQ